MQQQDTPKIFCGVRNERTKIGGVGVQAGSLEFSIVMNASRKNAAAVLRRYHPLFSSL
jgi:hypothetical protein